MNKKIFIGIRLMLIIYLAAIVGYLCSLGYNLGLKRLAVPPSTFPVLNATLLTKLVKQLETRSTFPVGVAPDLKLMQFGKVEPFLP